MTRFCVFRWKQVEVNSSNPNILQVSKETLQTTNMNHSFKANKGGVKPSFLSRTLQKFDKFYFRFFTLIIIVYVSTRKYT